MRFLLLTAMILLSGFINTSESTHIAAQIAYQGILTDNAGNPVADGTHSLEFSLNTDSLGGTAIWAETKVVSTKGGMFSHMLGSVISLETLKFDLQYWLSIKKDGNQIGQRVKLGVVPYARRSIVADSAGKVDGKNIVVNSIDSTMITNGAVTSNEILNGTIGTEDVNIDFKAPLALLSDSAKWIRASTITNKMIQNSMIGDTSISSSQIKDNSIIASKISRASIFDSNIVTINWSKLTNSPLLSQSYSNTWNGSITTQWTAICEIDLKAKQGDIFKVSFYSLNPSNADWALYYANSSGHNAFISGSTSNYELLLRLPADTDGFLVKPNIPCADGTFAILTVTKVYSAQ